MVWGTCGTGEMGKSTEAAPDVCVTTSGNARNKYRQKGREAGRRPQDPGSSSPPLQDLTHRGLETGASALPPFLTFLKGPWSLRPGQEDKELPCHPGAPCLPSSQKLTFSSRASRLSLDWAQLGWWGSHLFSPCASLAPSLPRNLRWSRHSWNHSSGGAAFIPWSPHPQWPL